MWPRRRRTTVGPESDSSLGTWAAAGGARVTLHYIKLTSVRSGGQESGFLARGMGGLTKQCKGRRGKFLLARSCRAGVGRSERALLATHEGQSKNQAGGRAGSQMKFACACLHGRPPLPHPLAQG